MERMLPQFSGRDKWMFDVSRKAMHPAEVGLGNSSNGSRLEGWRTLRISVDDFETLEISLETHAARYSKLRQGLHALSAF
jgi:hypothetical protein